MFEPQLYEAFADILEHKLRASQQLQEMLRRVDKTDMHEPVLRLHAAAQRNLQLTQRLVEIVS